MGDIRVDTLFRASSDVGLTPGLAAFDIEQSSGIVIGDNPAGPSLAPAAGTEIYTGYMGHLDATKAAGQYTLVATPVELGGFNLLPTDRVKQGGKALVGAMVVEPATASWMEDAEVFDRRDGVGTRRTRARATVCPSGRANCPTAVADSFRAFSAILQKAVTQYYGDASPLQHMNGEGVGIPEDSQEASGMAVNYGVEPAWFRFRRVPQAPFGYL